MELYIVTRYIETGEDTPLSRIIVGVFSTKQEAENIKDNIEGSWPAYHLQDCYCTIQEMILGKIYK